MKRLLSSLLSLSLAVLSVQPAAAAASRSLVINTGAPMATGLKTTTLPTLGAPVLPAVNVPGMTIPAATVPQAALPGLQQLGAEVAPEAKNPQGALDKAYTGEQAGRQQLSASPVNGGEGSGSTGGSNLQPSSSQSPKVPNTPSSPRRSFNSQRGAVNVKVIAIIAGVVLTIAVIIGIIIHKGNQKDKLWSNSPAAAEVVQIEKARRANDAETLFKIAGEAKKRAADQREKIADAKSRRADKVGDKSMSDAEALAAFDELAATRAELNANEVSNDPARRVGAKKFETWKQKVGELEADAKATGFEGRLGNELDSLKGEVGAENVQQARLSGNLSEFEKHVPSLGGGALKEQREKSRTELLAFDSEIVSEKSLHDQELAEARGRIYTRLAAGNAEFREHAARRDALSKLENGVAKTAVDRAVSLELEVRTIADKIKLRDDALKAAQTLLDEAKQHDIDAKKLERVEVKVPAKDAQGNPMVDGAGNPLYTIEIQDQSGPEKQKASDKRKLAQGKKDDAQNAAIAARDAAVRAGRDRDDLDRQAELLRGDEALKAEKVTSVPSSIPGVQVYVVWRWVSLDRQDADFFLTVLTYDQANELRAKFSTTKGSFEQTKKSIGDAETAQSNWLNGKVTDELESQKKSGF